MKTNRLEKGFSALTALLVVVAIGLFGFVGYKGYQLVSNSMAVNEAAKIQPATASDVTAVDKVVNIVDSTDLDEINAQLDAIDLDNTDDSSLLSSEMASFN